MLASVVVGSLAVLGLAAPAQAGSGGAWSTLATGSGLWNITQPDVVQLPSAQGSRLLVGWSTEGTSQGVYTRQVSTSGKPVGGTSTVVKGWASLDQRVAFARSNGKVVVALQGIRTTSPAEKYQGAVAYATSTNGSSWSLAPGGLSRSEAGGYALDVVDVKGTLVSAFTQSSDDRLSYHVGADTVMPSTSADRTTTAHSGNAYEGALARDARTGEVWAAWYQLGSSSKPSDTGIWVQRVLPTASKAVRAPGSGTALQPDQRVALVARSGGGVVLAYTVGYPTTRYVRVWRVGSSTSSKTYTQVKATDARDVSASAGPGGRVWVAWATAYSGSKAVVHAVRSNTAATRLGAVVASKPVHSSTIWKTAIEGSRGVADVVVTADVKNGSSAIGIYHTQLGAGLTVKTGPSSVRKAKGGTVTVTVTDAGAKVKGATFTYKGRKYTTGSHGTAKVKVAKGTSKGTKTLTVKKSGYVSKKATFKVRS
ncbi:hypothetical protein [Cellulomonas sp. HZM]|uniref:hypothetical protein n=1 Tax=Cellulomonas sp. HZM TaxID=1454010 RepID=UPI0004934E55|nr:hypothetical protein [Cellulomonas sp. HZM]